jgi:hypothetical protein
MDGSLVVKQFFQNSNTFFNSSSLAFLSGQKRRCSQGFQTKVPSAASAAITPKSPHHPLQPASKQI